MSESRGPGQDGTHPGDGAWACMVKTVFLSLGTSFEKSFEGNRRRGKERGRGRKRQKGRARERDMETERKGRSQSQSRSERELGTDTGW